MLVGKQSRTSRMAQRQAVFVPPQFVYCQMPYSFCSSQTFGSSSQDSFNALTLNQNCVQNHNYTQCSTINQNQFEDTSQSCGFHQPDNESTDTSDSSDHIIFPQLCQQRYSFDQIVNSKVNIDIYYRQLANQPHLSVLVNH